MKQGIITKTCAVAAALAMGVSLAACGGGSSADSDKGHVYFMNNKSEVVDQYKQLAEMYTEKTGVQVDVQTGASGTYDATMSSELAKSNAPTMFNISGFDQFAKYQKYCEPLQDTEAYKLLTDDGKAYSYTIDGDSFTLPYAAEWYGIIYNKKIINDYASKNYAVIKSADDTRITRRSRPWPSPSTSTRTISALTARSRRQVWMPPTHTVSPRIWGASRCTTSTRI